MSIIIHQAIDDVLQILEGIPLSDSTVRYYGFCYRTILKYCTENSRNSFLYEDAEKFCLAQQERVARREICNTYALIMRKAAYSLSDYLANGTLNWDRQNYRSRLLPDCFQRILDDFELAITSSLSNGSVRLVLQMSGKFLSFLAEQGCTDISSMGIPDVSRFICQESPKHTSHKINLTWPIKKFLHYLCDKGMTTINADFFLENPVPSRKKVFPSLDDSEIKALFAEVDQNNSRGRRDYAIMRLALDTGLRWSDIIGLKLSEIDWSRKEISFIQKKTGMALALPMTIAAGNAIVDYILNARPKTDCPYVFLRLRRPYDRLNSRTPAANIMSRYQSEGFSHHSGDGKGFHAFRRTMGTQLIKADVPLTTISQILGHTNLDSTKRYLFLNDEKMLACCMDLGSIPCRKEGMV